MVRTIRPVWARYAAACISVLAALILAFGARSFFASTFFALFQGAVMFSAWYGGLLPGLFATFLSVVVVDYYFFPPLSLWDLKSDQWIHLFIFVGVAFFISYLNEKRVRAEEALRMSHDELEAKVEERTAELRLLSGRLLHLRDEERRRVARELHETIAQSLVALKMDLAVLSRSTQIRSTQEREALDEAVSLSQECMSQARTLSYLLHPPLLDESGLSSALRWYIEGFERRSGIKTNLEISSDLGRFPQEVETTVFRIVQECLTNIHRHSGSNIATIRIAQTPLDLQLEVCDDGCGMPIRTTGHKKDLQEIFGVGIAGMHERVQQSGGRMEILSNGRGTTVKAVLRREGGAA